MHVVDPVILEQLEFVSSAGRLNHVVANPAKRNAITILSANLHATAAIALQVVNFSPWNLQANRTRHLANASAVRLAHAWTVFVALAVLVRLLRLCAGLLEVPKDTLAQIGHAATFVLAAHASNTSLSPPATEYPVSRVRSDSGNGIER